MKRRRGPQSKQPCTQNPWTGVKTPFQTSVTRRRCPRSLGCRTFATTQMAGIRLGTTEKDIKKQVFFGTKARGGWQSFWKSNTHGVWPFRRSRYAYIDPFSTSPDRSMCQSLSLGSRVRTAGCVSALPTSHCPVVGSQHRLLLAQAQASRSTAKPKGLLKRRSRVHRHVHPRLQ